MDVKTKARVPVEGLLDVNQVAAKLNCSPWTIRLWESEGRIRAVRLGRLLRFRPEDVEAFVERGAGVRAH
jgi:excisionase family DNA binding protein